MQSNNIRNISEEGGNDEDNDSLIQQVSRIFKKTTNMLSRSILPSSPPAAITNTTGQQSMSNSISSFEKNEEEIKREAIDLKASTNIEQSQKVDEADVDEISLMTGTEFLQTQEMLSEYNEVKAAKENETFKKEIGKLPAQIDKLNALDESSSTFLSEMRQIKAVIVQIFETARRSRLRAQRLCRTEEERVSQDRETNATARTIGADITKLYPAFTDVALCVHEVLTTNAFMEEMGNIVDKWEHGEIVNKGEMFLDSTRQAVVEYGDIKQGTREKKNIMSRTVAQFKKQPDDINVIEILHTTYTKMLLNEDSFSNTLRGFSEKTPIFGQAKSLTEICNGLETMITMAHLHCKEEKSTDNTPTTDETEKAKWKAKKKLEKKAAQAAKKLAKEKDGPSGETVCRNCGKAGHWASACKEPRKCYKCQQTGHIARDCKTEKAQEEESVESEQSTKN